MLTLFADLASVATTKTQLYDLGSLLPVIAACCCGDESVSLHSDAQMVKVGMGATQIAVLFKGKGSHAQAEVERDADFHQLNKNRI